MNQKTEALVNYIQERCLWQFYSRSWDREENIEGILTKVREILAGENPVLETDADRCWFADAKILVSDFKYHFPWLREENSGNVNTIIDGVKKRMREIAIEKSHNEELNISNY